MLLNAEDTAKGKAGVPAKPFLRQLALWASRTAFLLAALEVVLMAGLIVSGFPVKWLGGVIAFKNLRKPFHLFAVFLLTGLLLDPQRSRKLGAWKERLGGMLSRPLALWVMAAAYLALFSWQQLSEYLAVEINFIPFGFYDYMFYFLEQNKINYTGLLHGYYHVNNILFVLYPVWLLFKSPLVLVFAHGLLAAGAALPLYGIAREKFGPSVIPFFIALIYLNYRYVQMMLEMNFIVEIFYPLAIFSCFYFALRRQWVFYYTALILGLLVKEDSFVYFSIMGLAVFFLPGAKKHAAFTAAVSLAYFAAVIKWFMPLTNNDILESNLRNYAGHGTSVSEVMMSFLRNPLQVFEVLFGSELKIKTLTNIFYRLLFIPFFSPLSLLALASVFPVFLHGTGIDTDYHSLHSHYSAAVIPFVFIALVYGFSNVLRIVSLSWRENAAWILCLALVLVNGGYFRTRTISPENEESIRWAKSIPLEANLVTHGHLLPYIGYRPFNYYFDQALEDPANKAHRPYAEADFYLIDLNVNLFPVNRDFFDDKIKQLKGDPAYELVRHDQDRYVFERKVKVSFPDEKVSQR